jgi:hypothetical protein
MIYSYQLSLEYFLFHKIIICFQRRIHFLKTIADFTLIILGNYSLFLNLFFVDSKYKMLH